MLEKICFAARDDSESAQVEIRGEGKVMARELSAVLADLIRSARVIVDREVRVMEEAVMRLERAERNAALNRWPEGERWRELADDDFVRLKNSVDYLYDGEIARNEAGRKVVSLAR